MKDLCEAIIGIIITLFDLAALLLLQPGLVMSIILILVGSAVFILSDVAWGRWLIANL